MRQGDEILEVNGKHVSTIDDVSLYFAVAKPGEKVDVTVRKSDGKEFTTSVKPKKVKEKGKKVYRFGITMKSSVKHGIIPAVVYTYRKTCSLFKQMFITVGYLFTGGIKLNQLSGPVGIYSIVGEQSSAGLFSILYLVAYLSINVGFINLIPFPGFDGGHILFLLIEKIKGSPVDPKTENIIHNIGLLLLMMLMIYITFNDIIKLF